MRTSEAQSPVDPCTAAEEWISAAADGEAASVPPDEVTAHLGACPACREFASAVDQGRDRSSLVPLRVAPPVAEHSASIVSKANADDRSAVGSILTVLLVVLALRIASLAVGDLTATGAFGANAHAAKHLGAFGVAYAAGLILVAVRPARARAMLPVAVVLTVAMALGAVVDVVEGRVPLSGEQSHLPELVSAVVLWMIARRQSHTRESAARSQQE